MKVQIVDEAAQDLVDGYRFYESQAAGIDIDSLRLYAGIHFLHFGYHRLLSKRFPFAVYYRIENDVIRVYAVLDCRRDPSWIRDRLR